MIKLKVESVDVGNEPEAASIFHENYYLSIDDETYKIEPISAVNLTKFDRINNSWSLKDIADFISTDRLTIQNFKDYKLKDIPENLRLCLDSYRSSSFVPNEIRLSRTGISFRIHYNHENWPNDWSIKALFSEIKQSLIKSTFFTSYDEDLTNDYYSIYLSCTPKKDIEIKRFYDLGWPKFKELHQSAIEILNNRFGQFPFQAKFIFPADVEQECIQYLSYFGQFLSDIGIETDTELSQKGKEVLFSTRPKNKNEAIEKISQAFSLFLTVPSIYDKNIFTASGGIENQIKFQRMEAVIGHLQSQLKLAEATNLAYQDHINTLKEFKTNILAKSLIKVIENEKESDGISYLDNLINIKPFKGDWFDINTPKVVLKVKQLLEKFKK